eukprot:jgi/Psemu1/291630/fgenesh1_pg.765_\
MSSDQEVSVPGNNPLEEIIRETDEKGNPGAIISSSALLCKEIAPARLDLEIGLETAGVSDHIVANEATRNEANFPSTTSLSKPVASADYSEDNLLTTPGAYAIQNPLSASGGNDSATVIRRFLPELRQGHSRCFGIGVGDETISVTTDSQAGKLSTNVCSLENQNSIIDPQTHPHLRPSLAIDAVCIEKATLVVVKEPHEEERDKFTSRKTSWIFFACCFVLLLVVAIALGVAFSNESKQIHSLPPHYTEQNRDYLISLMGPLSGSVGDQVFNRGNSTVMSLDRIAALDWLVHDTQSINLITQSVRTGSNATAASISEWKLRQRYVLALLFFATNGRKWADPISFLSEKDECQWSKANSFTNDGVKVEQKDVITIFSDTMGVTCNDESRVNGISLQLNNLAGTLPQELSHFKDTLEELNLGGASIVGTIPEEYERFAKLKALALNDNCFTGAMPQGLLKVSTLAIVNFVNNPGISGSLNEFCSHNDYKEGVIAVAGDCNSSTVECECCICCNHDNFQCHDRQTGNSWNSYSLDIFNKAGLVKSFDKKPCRTIANKRWIEHECPYVINTSTDLETHPFLGQCTTNSSQEGARLSFDHFFWE